MSEKKLKLDEYRICKYPDKDSKSGHVFFADKRIRKRFLFVFTYSKWETVKWNTGESIHWFDFDRAAKDVQRLKCGLKIYE